MILFLQVMWLLCIKRRPWIREDNWLSPAKEICDFLVALSVADPGSGKMVSCLLKEKAIRDKKSGGASSRPIVLKDKSNKYRSTKSGAIEKVSAIA